MELAMPVEIERDLAVPAHQPIREKINMYDRCIIASRDTWPAPGGGHAPCSRSKSDLLDVNKFLKRERDHLRNEIQQNSP